MKTTSLFPPHNTAPCRAFGLRGRAGRGLRFAIVALLFQALTGCGGGSGSGSGPGIAPPVASPPPVFPEAWDGLWGATVTTPSGDATGNAVLTRDGHIRLQTDYSFTGGETAQFFGRIDVSGNQASGEGTLIGQNCADTPPGRFCGKTMDASVVLGPGPFGNLRGEIALHGGLQPEIWLLKLARRPIGFAGPGTIASLAGVYSGSYYPETSGMGYTFGSDATLSVDMAGKVFFQSAGTHCVGNGIVSPYPEGSRNVFRVSLLVENCSGDAAYLNGVFEELAAGPLEDGWGFTYLHTWMSKNDGDTPPAAVSLFLDRI